MVALMDRSTGRGHRDTWRSSARLLVALVLVAACSPEARRERDGGLGADPGNKNLVARDLTDPHAADTTLWPGRSPAPTDLMARGVVPPPTFPAPEEPTAKRGETPIKPDVPPTEPQQRTFDAGRSADPRRQTNQR
jgi:hypothetical protein